MTLPLLQLASGNVSCLQPKSRTMFQKQDVCVYLALKVRVYTCLHIYIDMNAHACIHCPVISDRDL
jgi:hypothetical protein